MEAKGPAMERGDKLGRSRAPVRVGGHDSIFRRLLCWIQGKQVEPTPKNFVPQPVTVLSSYGFEASVPLLRTTPERKMASVRGNSIVTEGGSTPCQALTHPG